MDADTNFCIFLSQLIMTMMVMLVGGGSYGDGRCHSRLNGVPAALEIVVMAVLATFYDAG